MHSDNKKKFKGKKAVVIGTGPAGSAAAAYLSNYGFHTKLYDRLDDPRIKLSSNRVLPVGIFRNSVDVLRKIYTELPYNQSGYKNGLHEYYGKFHYLSKLIISKGVNFVSNNKKRASVRFSSAGAIGERNTIQIAILNALSKFNTENVEMEFNCPCEKIDFENQIAIFKNGEIREDYDLLIGADGANSVIRKQLEKEIQDYNVEYLISENLYLSFKSSVPLTEADSQYLDKYLGHGEYNYFKCKADVFEGKKTPKAVSIARSEDGYYYVVMVASRDYVQNIKGKESK